MATKPIDLAESVAGEEDPGASLDMTLPQGVPPKAAKPCPACGGSGRSQGQACTECSGTGRVTVGIGGG
jgi:hypothetical protein